MSAPATRWIAEVKAHGPASVGQAFGLDLLERPSPGSLSPCPACGAEKRHPRRHDRRGAVGLTRGDGAGWRCFECEASGDALDLAALASVGRVPGKGDPAWREVLAACSSRGLCEGPRGATAPRCALPPRHPPAPPVRPHRAAAAWAACLPPPDDAEAAAWLRSKRGLDPGRVEDFGLARALPMTGTLPVWARLGRRSWRETSHRVVVPLFGAGGSLESLHARALDPAAEPKAVSPAGAEVRGLVMADAGAAAMLRGEVRPAVLVVAEGVPDFLSWATRYSDADEDTPAVLGVIAGSWTPELAARVPDGTTVHVRTHADAAGAKYAEAICASLAARCAVFRREVKP